MAELCLRYFQRETEVVQLVLARTCGRLSASLKETIRPLSFRESPFCVSVELGTKHGSKVTNFSYRAERIIHQLFMKSDLKPLSAAPPRVCCCCNKSPMTPALTENIFGL